MNELRWVALALGALGVLLLRRGWFVRRRGEEPRCQRCGYDLSHNESGRCPECGADLATPRAVVRGVRRRRGLVTLAGLMSIALAVACMTPQARDAYTSINWYAWSPTRWVLNDLRRNGAAGQFTDQLRALAELGRRRSAGKLSDDQKRQIIETLLAAQSAGAIPPEFLEYLQDRIIDGELTDPQRDRFFHQLIHLSLAARPRVASGEMLPWVVAHNVPTLPSRRWSFKGSFASMSVDGKRIPNAAGGSMSSTLMGGGSQGSHLRLTKDIRPGPHVLQTLAVFEIFQGDVGDESRSLGKLQFPLQAPFELLPAGKADAIKETPDPSLRAVLQAAIKPEDITDQGPVFLNVAGNIRVDNLPVNIAFVVILRVDGHEYKCDTLAWPKNRGPLGSSFYAVDNFDPMPERVDVILRSDPAVARHTIDMTEIWQGELEYKDLPVKRSKPSQPASTAPFR